jgi:acetoin utilization protein AcuB
MLVRDVMQVRPVAVTVETRLPEVMRLLQPRGYRHLPVLEGGQLVGIISDRDVKQSVASAALASDGREGERLIEELTAGQIMTRRVVTVGPTCGVEEAARLMATGKFGALPVTDGDRLIGIVTETDVLHLFVRALGVLEPSSRIDVLVRDPETGLGEAVRAVEDTGSRVSSVMTLAAPNGEREIVLRVATIDSRRAVKALRDRGYVVREMESGAAA